MKSSRRAFKSIRLDNLKKYSRIQCLFPERMNLQDNFSITEKTLLDKIQINEKEIQKLQKQVR